MVSRATLETVLREQTPCIVAMEAYATSHFLGRFSKGPRHKVRLILQIDVRPFVKQQKNDAADAAAIAEAALGPNLHYAAVKSAERQTQAVAFRTHQSFVGQRTELINAMRGHLGECGLIVPHGLTGLKTVAAIIGDDATELPDAVHDSVRLYLDQIALLTQKIVDLHCKLRTATKVDETKLQLCTVPGIGPATAGALMAFTPDLRTFASGRNIAAWLGLVLRQRPTEGKTKLGGVGKMGEADIRKLLIVGAMNRIRCILRKGVLLDNWFGRVLGRKPRMVAAVALASKMARMIRAMMIREENYRIACTHLFQSKRYGKCLRALQPSQGDRLTIMRQGLPCSGRGNQSRGSSKKAR